MTGTLTLTSLGQFLYSILTQLYSGAKLKKAAAHAYARDTFEAFSNWRATVKPQIVIPLSHQPSSLQPPTNIVHFRYVSCMLLKQRYLSLQRVVQSHVANYTSKSVAVPNGFDDLV